MRHWLEKQPDGQGLATEFEDYFKKLSDYDKEVRYIPINDGKYTSNLLVISPTRKK